MYRKIGDDSYIIHLQDDFYTVNEFTMKLIQAYAQSEDTAELAALLGYTENEVKEVFSELDEVIDHAGFDENFDDLSFPLHVKWKITSSCNIRCKHCYIGEKDNAQLSADQNMEIARRIAKSGAFVATISGGEPLIVRELPEIAAYLIEQGIELHIFTNGMLIKDFILKLEELSGLSCRKMVQFNVSLDGMRNAHDYMRGDGTFDEAVGGIEFALEREYSIKTNTTVTSKNIDEIVPLIQFCRNKGIASSQFSNLIIRGWAVENLAELEMSDEDQERFVATLRDFTAEPGYDHSIYYSPLDRSESSDEPVVYRFEDGKEVVVGRDTWKCGAGKGKCVVNERGDVLCCPFFQESKIGNILDKDFRDLWEVPLRKDFINKLKSINGTNRYCAVMKDDCYV